MQQFQDQKNNKEPFLTLICRCTVSLLLVLLTQFTLSLVPRCFSTSPLLLQLALSVLVFGRWFRLILGVYASAPAFVFFNILFVWGLYWVVIRRAIPHLISAVFSGEVVMLFIGLCSILSSDPGFVSYGSSYSDNCDEMKALEVEARNEDSFQLKRVRYCKICKAYIKGFDHHCPAFGNCIGQNNHILFMVLLLGFLSTEASYILCSFQFARDSHIFDGTRFENGLGGSLVISTMLFTLLQVLWQAVFMAWHIYCICFNIRTDEWVSLRINWKKYSEFQVIIQSQSGGSFAQMQFMNPYDKGILQNVKEFFAVGD
ncbi:probable protein S-acyltransferase 15 isoform X4 [Jatropha curcas]|uniref:probable protein S-acyltransferase 15 isoform X4 n=1 Tax=Jatropha curcas TaxID=180498 RepID=UPI0009D65505|nr:probable protein S-acyltransferase 15 isoform X4 [Jatropha curcas]